MTVPFNLQAYVKPVPELALSTTEPPAHKLADAAGVMVAVGKSLVVRVLETDTLQPDPLLMVQV